MFRFQTQTARDASGAGIRGGLRRSSANGMVRFGSKTVMTAPKRYFRSTPNNGHHQTGPLGPVRAMNGLTLTWLLWE
jgi:hypothetical protein